MKLLNTEVETNIDTNSVESFTTELLEQLNNAVDKFDTTAMDYSRESFLQGKKEAYKEIIDYINFIK